MNSAVAAIREREQQLGFPQHIVTVQGTRAWGRVLDYYVANPITAGGGANVVYETHVCELRDRNAVQWRRRDALLHLDLCVGRPCPPPVAVRQCAPRATPCR